MRFHRLVSVLTLGAVAAGGATLVTRAAGPASGSTEPVIETAVAADAQAATTEVASPSKGAVKRLRPVVGYPVSFGVTPALRDLPAMPAKEMKPNQDPREIRNPSLAEGSRRLPIKRVIRRSTTGDQALYAPPAPTPMD